MEALKTLLETSERLGLYLPFEIILPPSSTFLEWLLTSGRPISVPLISSSKKESDAYFINQHFFQILPLIQKGANLEAFIKDLHPLTHPWKPLGMQTAPLKSMEILHIYISRRAEFGPKCYSAPIT